MNRNSDPPPLKNSSTEDGAPSQPGSPCKNYGVQYLNVVQYLEFGHKKNPLGFLLEGLFVTSYPVDRCSVLPIGLHGASGGAGIR